MRWVTVLPSRLSTHRIKSACWDNWAVLFRSQGTLSFAIIVCRWREDASLRKEKWLGGIWPEVITDSRTLLITCGIRGDCVVTDGLRRPREQHPTSVSCSCTFFSSRAVMVQGVGAGGTGWCKVISSAARKVWSREWNKQKNRGKVPLVFHTSLKGSSIKCCFIPGFQKIIAGSTGIGETPRANFLLYSAHGK